MAPRMLRKTIQTSAAPKAIGPYSQAIDVAAGRMVIMSGQIPLDPSTGELVAGDVGAQTRQVMENLKAVLSEAGFTFGNVVRCGIFLVDLQDFAKMNEVYAEYFPSSPPARATVQVAALPRAAKVEIDAIAVG
jgi:2-iminobutanoate/2-iminopropanoate deaminase